MPQKDGTGPKGQGSKTGQGKGACGTNQGGANKGKGRGSGQGDKGCRRNGGTGRGLGKAGKVNRTDSTANMMGSIF